MTAGIVATSQKFSEKRNFLPRLLVYIGEAVIE